MEQITIAGHAFDVPMRYAEGHEITAYEANVLNQVFHEKLRNNFAERVKAALAAGPFDHFALQQELNAYAESYQLGSRVRRGQGSRKDPVFAEALVLVDNALRRKGIKPAEVTQAAKRQFITENPSILAIAKRRIADAQGIPTEDLTDSLSPAAAE